MNPYEYLAQTVQPEQSLLSLCCGVGLEFQFLRNSDITGVDITPEYLAKVNVDYPQVKTVLSDVMDYIKAQPDNSFDVISFIDGLEHLTKEEGKTMLKECKRVARLKVIVFTPEGYVTNEPKSAWGIDSNIGDHHQKHLSGWYPKDLARYGLKLVNQNSAINVLGDKYNESTYLYEKS